MRIINTPQHTHTKPTTYMMNVFTLIGPVIFIILTAIPKRRFNSNFYREDSDSQGS